MTLKVAIRGAAVTGRAVGRLAERIQEADLVLEGMGRIMLEEIKERHLSGQTVDSRTGLLRESWTVFGTKVPKPIVIIRTPVFYAAFVNYRRYPGKPPTLFLQKAFTDARGKMMEFAREAFRFGR